MKMAASISECGRFRWTLTRVWDDRPMLLVVMFNPSDADHAVNDPTVTLLMHIASHNGYGGITVVNLCPLRSSTTASVFRFLKEVNGRRAVGEDQQAMRDNIDAVEAQIESCNAILTAWGSMGWRAENWYSRVEESIRDAAAEGKPVFRLGVCQNGHPMHPLARGKHKIPKTAKLQPWIAS